MMARIALVVAVAACQHDVAVGESSGVLFGAAVVPPMADIASREAGFTQAEMLSGRHFDLHRIFRNWSDPVPGELERWTIANGHTPVISFKTDLQWAAFAKGDGDAQLSAIAAGYAALGVPVFGMFDQSPENTPEQGTPGDFAAAYRHVVETFRTAGVTNVAWIFNLKSPSFPGRADQFYPGDDVIDWIGVAAYNFGINNDGGRWVPFEDLIAGFITWGGARGKPLFVSEWASEEDLSQPGRKGMWIEDAKLAIQRLPQVRAMSAQWVEANTLAFDSSPSSLEAFRAFAADPYTHLRDSP